MTEDQINRVARKNEREALLSRLHQHDNDPKQAFTGNNSLAKNPIYLDSIQKIVLADKVKLVSLAPIYTKRVGVGPDLDEKKIAKIIDPKIREKLLERLAQHNNDPKKAFVNLDENPIFLDKAQIISIKRVTMNGVSNVEALHTKKCMIGQEILSQNGLPIPNDFVSTGSNHHVAIFEDNEGNLQEEIVSFYEAVSRAVQNQTIIKREHENDWKFLFTLKQNEYFVFGDENFNLTEIELLNPANYSKISKYLYRVQKMASKYYVFRHHLETNVEEVKELIGKSYKRIRSLNQLKSIIKVRVNHLGQIVKIGEYK
jgi:CRISPR-associated endonuclease Csn1